jgi:hypothetical protein
MGRMTTPVRKHLVTIDGATPEVQHWVDDFVASARAGTGDWPHPHTGITLTVVPLARLDQVLNQVGWARVTGRSPIPDPNSGGVYHTVLHGLLGDFH